MNFTREIQQQQQQQKSFSKHFSFFIRIHGKYFMMKKATNQTNIRISSLSLALYQLTHTLTHDDGSYNAECEDDNC
jgi:hypothetical protein